MTPGTDGQRGRAGRGLGAASGIDIPRGARGLVVRVERVGQSAGRPLQRDGAPPAQHRWVDPCLDGHACGEVERRRIGN